MEQLDCTLTTRRRWFSVPTKSKLSIFTPNFSFPFQNVELTCLDGSVCSCRCRHFDYISQRKNNVYTRRHHNLTSIPPELDRKAYLLRYFEDYMAKTLRRDVPWTFEDVERKKNMDFLVKYYRMKNAIVFKMSNDVLQVCFFSRLSRLDKDCRR